jgi:hypothetical protein
MRINNKNTVALHGKETGNDKFPYLGRIVTKEGGRVEDVRNRISKVNGALKINFITSM